jgi:ferredoxin
MTAAVQEIRCVGCGLCVPACPEAAIHLLRRAEAAPPPRTLEDWMQARAAERQLDMSDLW